MYIIQVYLFICIDIGRLPSVGANNMDDDDDDDVANDSDDFPVAIAIAVLAALIVIIVVLVCIMIIGCCVIHRNNKYGPAHVMHLVSNQIIMYLN